METEPRNWDAFIRDAATWADKQFSAATSASKAEHLRREAIELAESGGKDAEEMADVFLLLIHLSHGENVDLLEEARKKLAKNKARKWGTPDAQGVVEHLRKEDAL